MDFENTDTNKLTNNNSDIVKTNITNIILYALSLATALGFNDLILVIFDSFKWVDTRIIAKATYFVTIFGVTIFTAYYLKGYLVK